MAGGGSHTAAAAASPPADDHPDHEAERDEREEEDPHAAPAPTDPAEVAAAIVKQVEFYFSDANLPTDKHLLKHVKKDPEGWGECCVGVGGCLLAWQLRKRCMEV